MKQYGILQMQRRFNLEEIWKDIADYEMYYQISNFGRVKNKKTGLILKQNKNRGGYLQIVLSVKGNRKTCRVHRLVANAFIEKVKGKEDVNHKDEDKENNHYTNLEWLTKKENNNYGTHNERINIPRRHAIYAIYPDGTDECFVSIRECARKLKLNHAHVLDVLKGNYKTHHGLRFDYMEDIKNV